MRLTEAGVEVEPCGKRTHRPLWASEDVDEEAELVDESGEDQSNEPDLVSAALKIGGVSF